MMKTLKNLSILFALVGTLFFASCDTFDLDQKADPNFATVDKANLERYMVSIQLSFANFIYRVGQNDAEVTRIEYMFGKVYRNNYEPAVLNTLWNTAYRDMLSDMKIAEGIASEKNAYKHLGVMKVLKAYTLMVLVDNFGDIPYSEALNPEVALNPHVDSGKDVYAAAIGLLDSAISDFQNTGGGIGRDFYYSNDFTKWIKLANTIKMNAYLKTRLVDASAISKFNAIVTQGNYILSNDEDFQFRYGTHESDPNTRHDAYDIDYTATGANNYRSNWLMSNMLANADPRMRYFFYRQKNLTPGCDTIPNQVDLPCSTRPRPNHYPSDMAYCCVGTGYWGRDHGNDEGIPPDGLKRTVVGVYPAGGKFDDDDFTAIGKNIGGKGAGILPIMLASWVDLMKAEVAMVNNDYTSAETLLGNALQKHISKVQTFITLDPDANPASAPTASNVTTFIDNIKNSFNTASTPDDKWEIFANEMFIAHYGNGIDAYNFYRRTGFPHKLQYSLEPNPGKFIRSFFYPSSEADVNTNIIQKNDVDVKVFWDNNPNSPSFPFAN